MSRDDYYASPFGATYSAYMERPRLSHRIGWLVWGGDTKPYYESMAAVAEVPAGGTVVDCPCGAGPALRAVPAGGSIHYVGADLSPAMIRRARKRAAARGLAAEFVEADATELPLPSACANLFLSFWGLHCFADPAEALAEAARILKPGGRLSARPSSAAQTPCASASSSAPTPATSARLAPSPRSNPGSPRPASPQPAPIAPARSCSSMPSSRPWLFKRFADFVPPRPTLFGAMGYVWASDGAPPRS